jgi:predicted nucleic acid-binding protein
VKVLLDTCTLSEVRRPDGHPAVKSAVREIADEDLYLSVLSVGEIVEGIALLAAGRKKKALSLWLVALEGQFTGRILGLGVETGRIWDELTARAQRSGVVIPAPDGLLAATALRHDLHVMTRSAKQFAASGSLIIDPWQGANHCRRRVVRCYGEATSPKRIGERDAGPGLDRAPDFSTRLRGRMDPR